jgi:hypothetical protein
MCEHSVSWKRIEPKNKIECNSIRCYYCRFRQFGQLRIYCYKYQEFMSIYPIKPKIYKGNDI